LASGSRARGPRYAWATLPTEELLELRLCDLGLGIEGSALERRIDALYRELELAGLRFRPYVWLSTDWFAPHGMSGFAIPFFLAHPRLVQLEHRQMLEAEGGTRAWCMRLLRHETGHAIDNAYRLHRRAAWRAAFGAVSVPYRDTYAPRPDSRRFVHNLDHWYSQSHPLEDFAETFAVWLQPRSQWETVYGGWPALKKLRAVDAMMQSIAGRPPALRTTARPESIATLRVTLREYYERKHQLYATAPSVLEASLSRLFAPGAGRLRAATFLERYASQLRGRVSAFTGHHRYVVDQALREMILLCRERDLRLVGSERETRVGAAILLTAATARLWHGRRPRYRR
jgi:hypothetical protein